MANFYANVPVNLNEINFNLLASATEQTFYDNINWNPGNGRSYQDVVELHYGVGRDQYLATFLGHDIKFTQSGVAIAGTIESFSCFVKTPTMANPNGTANLWSMDGFKFSALEVQAAISTSGKTHDLSMFAQIFSGNDSIQLSQLADVVTAFAGNDLLVGFGGNDQLYGGSGLDTAGYQGISSDYVISRGLVKDLVQGRDGVDALFDIERLSFSDGNIALDTGLGETAGAAYRLYKAAFDRTPDQSGLSYWIKQLDNGATLGSVARGFLQSPEFQSLYGASASDRDFVAKLYNNVLDRMPDQGGYDYWLGQMQQGMSREAVLINFSESQENIANVSDIVAHGIPYQEWLA